MKRFLYTRPFPDDYGVSIGEASPKKNIEIALGRYNDENIQFEIASRVNVKWDKMNKDDIAVIRSLNELHDIVYNELRDLNKLPFSIEEYEKHVWDKSIPEWAVNPRYINDEDFPINDEFRNAWCDVTPETRIDIDLVKAKELKLTQLRQLVQEKFKELGFPQKLSPDIEDKLLTDDTKAQLKSLRDATEPLKALKVSGYNDEEVLQKIRTLGEL